MPSDIELIEQFSNGDHDAFELLIVRYEAKIYSTCYYFLKNKEDAEDVAQEVIIKLYRKLHTYRKEAAFSTWLNYISANACRDYLRKKKRNQVYYLDEDIQTKDGHLNREIASEDRLPDEVTEQKELQDLLQVALFTLSDEHRQILLMREYQTLSYEEIAEILELSIGTVKSRIYRARQDLKAYLSQSEHMQEYLRQNNN